MMSVCGFEDTHDLLAGRHLFLVEHAPHGLGHDLLCSGQEALQGLGQFFALVSRLLLQNRQDLLGLFDRRFGRPDELAIGGFPFNFGLFSTPAHGFSNLAGQTAHAANAVAEDALDPTRLAQRALAWRGGVCVPAP